MEELFISNSISNGSGGRDTIAIMLLSVLKGEAAARICHRNNIAANRNHKAPREQKENVEMPSSYLKETGEGFS